MALILFNFHCSNLFVSPTMFDLQKPQLVRIKGYSREIFMRCLGPDRTLFVMLICRTEEIAVLLRVLHGSPHRPSYLIKNVLSRPRYQIKIVSPEPRYLLKPVSSQPRCFKSFTPCCCLLLIQWFFKCIIMAKHLSVTHHDFDPKNLQNIPLRTHV